MLAYIVNLFITNIDGVALTADCLINGTLNLMQLLEQNVLNNVSIINRFSCC